MENNLPEGWTRVKLREVVEIGPRIPDVQNITDETQVQFLPMKLVSEVSGIIQLTEVRKYGEVAKGYTPFIDGDVIFAKVTPCMENGKIAIVNNLVNGIGFGSSEFHVMRASACLSNKFLFFFLVQSIFRKEAESSMTGAVGLRRVPRQFLEDYYFPLPPLPEQRRIVAKLDALMERVERNKQRLDKIPALLKRFRQSVLAAAVSGRLTEGWRRENIHLHSAIKDYNQIIENSSRKTVGNKRQKNSEEIEGNEIIIELVPEGWTTCALADIFKFIDYRGKTPSKSPAGIRLITAKNIKRGYVSNDPIEYVTDQTYRAWMTRGLPQKGDIFFVTEGHTMGFSALNNLNYKFAIGQRIITLQPIGKFYSELFFYFINSQSFQKLVELNSTGTAAIGIKGAKMKLLLIPFPPIQEQHEIVRRVNQLFAIADKIEARYVKAKAMLDRLPQSILAKAFRGELVPQDPEDEPAGVLLERVRGNKKNVAVKEGMK